MISTAIIIWFCFDPFYSTPAQNGCIAPTFNINGLLVDIPLTDIFALYLVLRLASLFYQNVNDVISRNVGDRPIGENCTANRNNQ